jgi:hypothetical protein
MSADRLGGWLRCRFRTVRRSFAGVLDGGTSDSAAVEPSVGSIMLRLTVWEQRL